jgi:hypothetical protein
MLGVLLSMMGESLAKDIMPTQVAPMQKLLRLKWQEAILAERRYT